VAFVIFCQLCCIVKFDMFTDHILDFDRYRCIFRTKLSFPMFPKYHIVSVFEVTVFDFVSDKKYENGNGFSVYRSFRPFSSIVILQRSNHSLRIFPHTFYYITLKNTHSIYIIFNHS
jgi:hypothetical protein